MSILSQGRFGRRAGTLAVAVLLIVTAGIDSARGSAKHTLEEPSDLRRICRLDCIVNVNGQLETALGEGKQAAHALNGTGTFRYLERRLPGAGRDARALRSIRSYEKATATINVAGQETSSSLREARKQLIAQGQRSGALFHSLDGLMYAEELELLHVPGDSLGIPALLPREPVEVGETWSVPNWAAQLIAGVDAVLKCELTCRLESVDDGTARVSFQGALQGATDGAATKVTLSGHYLYDVQQGLVSQLELEQSEKRSVGVVSPGLDVIAKIALSRSVTDDAGPLGDDAVATIPLEPDPQLLKLSFRTPWNVQLEFDRDWHIFQQSPDVVILRLLDHGSFLAQCNLTRISTAAPGQHTPEAEFQNDIREALGSRLKEFAKDEVLDTGDDTFKYRVTALGEANRVSMNWVYYLCADTSGAQTALVYSVESKLAERLGDRDRQMVDSLTFLEPTIVPTASPRP